MKIVIIDFGRYWNECPYPKAFYEDVEQTDNRSYESLDDVRTRASNGDKQAREFLAIGRNHRDVIDSDGKPYVAREWNVNQWVIDVTDLDGLLKVLETTDGELRHDRQSSLEWCIYVHSGPD